MPDMQATTMKGPGTALTAPAPESTYVEVNPVSDDTAPARKPISRRLRFEILRRDNYACRYCGGSAPDVALTVDHVLPVALGGGDDPSNLVTACAGCNAGKTSTSPSSRVVADVSAAALMYARALAQAVTERTTKLDAEEELIRTFWKDWDQFMPGKCPPLSSHWERTILNYWEAGLTPDDLNRYMQIAQCALDVEWQDTWRYFCGCCRNELERRHARARELIDNGEVR
jgi:hypothetical protein